MGNMFGNTKKENELLYELEYLKQYNAQLLQQNNILNFKIQELLSSNSTGEEFDITAGEYICGIDIKPGRYNIWLVSGDNGRIETTGNNWIIETLGTLYNGITYYENLSLRLNQKVKISGNVRVRFVKQKSLNINEDISIIENLHSQINKLKKEINDYKTNISHDDSKEYLLTQGYYYGGLTIGIGIYDVFVVSGRGCFYENGKMHQMEKVVDSVGQNTNLTTFRGVKVSKNTKLEVIGNIELKLVKVA